ncbi:triose or hexose phosphate/phosphate translocator, putative [Babesia caballi]|uniref:Triose or hexose phosphate/phosphate translocator, putative n=1 Tax=Babesia caballi TaxID=5871 RepID=A0AAV4LYB6_BABCB|nr:triose or hexose phosphate/phosphate translocator, putative [Babesia caballi]
MESAGAGKSQVTTTAAENEVRNSRKQLCMLCAALATWYALNVVHIMTTKSLLNVFPVPWSLCAFEFTVGWLFAGLFWGTGFRTMPRFPTFGVFAKLFIPLGITTVALHCGSIISMALGSVSFTTVIKAAEPVATAVLSILLLQDYLNIYVYLSLVPIVVGVGLASLKELDFNALSFISAMLSNVFEAFRAIVTKRLDTADESYGTNLTPTNIYMVFTLVASCVCVPMALIIEAPTIVEVWHTSTDTLSDWDRGYVIFQFVSCGFMYYIYNDCAFYCLGQMNQVTHSVLNTMKRIVVIVVSIIIFKNPVEPLGYVGMAIAIAGGLCYSLAKQGVCTRRQEVEVI